MDPRPGRSGFGGPRKFFAEIGDELLAFAEHQFALDVRGKDGHTQREHYEAGARQGSVSARLALQGAADLPELASRTWEAFVELAMTRGASGLGAANPIGWADIEAWQRLTGRRLLSHEVAWLRELDKAWLKAQAQKEGPDGRAAV